MSSDPARSLVQMRRRMLAGAVAGSFSGLSRFGGLFPAASPAYHGVRRSVGIPYVEGGGAEHQLDVYRPQDASGLLPVVVYIHGGAFHALSKDTHWLMALGFARRGYVVFNINYRLGPHHRYPAAAEDACAAWCWVAQHAAEYGGDPQRMVVAGESAGANLAAVVAVASAWRRAERWAQAVYDAPVLPRAALAACGIYQVTDTARLTGGRSFAMRDLLTNVEESYLPDDRLSVDLALADPLGVVESAAPSRPAPPFFLPVGTWDPLLEDTRRMAAALANRGVPVAERYYARELHAFHAFVWRAQAKQCWNDMHGFLAEQVAYTPA